MLSGAGLQRARLEQADYRPGHAIILSRTTGLTQGRLRGNEAAVSSKKKKKRDKQVRERERKGKQRKVKPTEDRPQKRRRW